MALIRPIPHTGANALSGTLTTTASGSFSVTTPSKPKRLMIYGNNGNFITTISYDEDLSTTYAAMAYGDTRSSQPAGRECDKVTLGTQWRNVGTLSISNNGFTIDTTTTDALIGTFYYMVEY